MPSLTNKTAMVAGASRGIGLAIARQLAEAGARTLLAARSIDVIEKEAEALRARGLQAVGVQLDVSDLGRMPALPEIDILINVAGTNIRRRFEQYTKPEYEKVLQTNLHGFVELTQKVGARMVARGSGG